MFVNPEMINRLSKRSINSSAGEKMAHRTCPFYVMGYYANTGDPQEFVDNHDACPRSKCQLWDSGDCGLKVVYAPAKQILQATVTEYLKKCAELDIADRYKEMWERLKKEFKDKCWLTVLREMHEVEAEMRNNA